jgi:anti-anti-sigma factor
VHRAAQAQFERKSANLTGEEREVLGRLVDHLSGYWQRRPLSEFQLGPPSSDGPYLAGFEDLRLVHSRPARPPGAAWREAARVYRLDQGAVPLSGIPAPRDNAGEAPSRPEMLDPRLLAAWADWPSAPREAMASRLNRDTAVVFVEGVMDALILPRLSIEATNAQRWDVKDVIFDLRDVFYADSRGLGALLAANERSREGAPGVAIVSSPAVDALLYTSGVRGVLRAIPDGSLPPRRVGPEDAERASA